MNAFTVMEMQGIMSNSTSLSTMYSKLKAQSSIRPKEKKKKLLRLNRLFYA